MTTTVRVLIEGNKACAVQVKDREILQLFPDGSSAKITKPGEFVTVQIHGEQSVIVKETGDFLT